MAKLTKHQKTMYSSNMEVAKEEGITFVQSDNKYITVAAVPHDRMGHFARVYVAYCSPTDTPKKKLGINAVMQRYQYDNYILLPMYGNKIQEVASIFMDMVDCY